MRDNKTFNYEGHTKLGEVKIGSINAPDESSAAEILREQGIYLSELNTDPIKTKYEKNALGSYAENSSDTPEEPEESEEPEEEFPDPHWPKGKCPQKSFTSPKKSVEEDIVPPLVSGLKKKIERVSNVLRILDTWGKLRESGSENITGCPVMGGQSWDMLLYNSEDKEHSEKERKEKLKKIGERLYYDVILDFCKEK